MALSTRRASSMPTALPPMQPVPISRFLIAMRSAVVKYLRQRAKRCGSVPSRQRMMLSLRAAAASSSGSSPSSAAKSNMLSQQSRRSPVWVKMSKMP